MPYSPHPYFTPREPAMQMPIEKPMAKIKTQAVPETLKNQCKRRIAELHEVFRQKGIHMRMPTISFDLRGKTAGRAYHVAHHIQLNAILLIENPDTFLNDVVGHELAHLACYQGFKATGHGPKWKQCMAMINHDPVRCHDMDTSNATVLKTHRALCNCPEPLKITSRQLPYLLRGQLRCKVCKAILLAHDPVLRQKSARIQNLAQVITPNTVPINTATPKTPPTTKQLGYMRLLSAKYKEPIPDIVKTCTKLASEWISSTLEQHRK